MKKEIKSKLPRLLYLDDERECPKGWELVRTADEAIKLLSENNYYKVSLDHDLGQWNYENPKTGMTVLNWLEKRHHEGHKIPFISIHTANAAVRRTMELVANRLNRESE